MLTPKQNLIVHLFQSALVVGAAIYAYLTHKIDSTVLAAVIGPYLGAYAGGGVAVKVLGQTSIPSVPGPPVSVGTVTPPPAPQMGATAAPPTVETPPLVPQVPFVAPSPTTLGPEHGNPPTA